MSRSFVVLLTYLYESFYQCPDVYPAPVMSSAGGKSTIPPGA
jgi:hypothetical protein